MQSYVFGNKAWIQSVYQRISMFGHIIANGSQAKGKDAILSSFLRD